MTFDIAKLERRLDRLEANRGASLRFGTVTEVNAEAGSARVQLPDGGGMVSMPLRVLQPRTLKDQRQMLPDLGEPVAVLFSGQGLEVGVVLGAHYSTQTPPPGQPAKIDYTRYEDGTEVFYDREAHKLTAKVKGDAEIDSTGSIRLTATRDIALTAPRISLAGMLRVTDKNGQAGSGELLGTYRVRQGNLFVPDGDMVASAVSLVDHVHDGVEKGPDSTGTPIGASAGGGDPNNSDLYELAFNHEYANPLPGATKKDNLLLCIPEIAHAESQRALLKKDTKGWLYLKSMLHKWFTGPPNADAESSREVFWVDLQWVLSYEIPNFHYADFCTYSNMYSPEAQLQLAKILDELGYLTDEKTPFDLTKPPRKPIDHPQPWKLWKDWYFNNRTVHYPLVDGIMACLGNFNFRALASGYTEPLPHGGHKITVEGISIFLWDSFNFNREDELGYWSCMLKIFSLVELENVSMQVFNSDFQNFRLQHKQGHDFMVLSNPEPVANFPSFSYVTER